MGGMHMDIDNPTPESVVIFVRADTKEEEIMDNINQAQTYFRKQVEKRPQTKSVTASFSQHASRTSANDVT